MLFTVKDDLNLLRDLKLTPKQLMFLKMLVPDGSDKASWRRKSYAMSLEFQDLCPLSAEEMTDLIKRSLIIDLNDTTGAIYYDCFEINPKFLGKFALKVVGFSGQLLEIYPHVYEGDGKKFFLKNVSAEEIAEVYLKGIKNDVEEHNRVLDDVKWAKERNLINIGLKNFVHSKFWLYIRDMKKRATPKPIINGRIG